MTNMEIQQAVEAALDQAFREALQEKFLYCLKTGNDATLKSGIEQLITTRAAAVRLISQPAAPVEWAGGGLTSS